jgi:hypothetical protein
MFCPRCAAENNRESNYCRKCGENLDLVSRALSGKLVAPPSDQPDRRSSPRLQRGIKLLFLGLAFLVLAITLGVAHQHEPFWLLIPAFILIAKGIVLSKPSCEGWLEGYGLILGARSGKTPKTPSMHRRSAQVTGTIGEGIPERLPSPPSVVEGTTRLFEPEGNPVIGRQVVQPQSAAAHKQQMR